MQPKTQFLAARIFKDGQLHWQYMADHDWLHGFSSAVPDGGGGAWLINQVQDDNPYSGMYMTHVNANGETEPVRTLRTGKEILLIHTAVSHPEDNSVTLYCSLVAKSKGVYIALAVTLDSAGNLLDTQARDFSMREDTAFWYFTEPSGKAWVFSQLPNSQSRNMLLVPFDDLPSLPPPALYFQ